MPNVNLISFFIWNIYRPNEWNYLITLKYSCIQIPFITSNFRSVLFTLELRRRYPEIQSFAVHPGVITTNLHASNTLAKIGYTICTTINNLIIFVNGTHLILLLKWCSAFISIFFLNTILCVVWWYIARFRLPSVASLHLLTPSHPHPHHACHWHGTLF